MIRWTSTRPSPPPQRWQSREEILKAHLDSCSPLELLRVRPDYYAATWGWDFKNKRYAAGRLALYEALERRAGFNPNQPRVPAGNPDGGQWTNESEGGVRITTSPGFLTGIDTIDNTSRSLSDTLTRVIELLDVAPNMSPQLYGIAVHVAFANAVRFQNLPGIGFWGVERTFSLEDSDPRYGLPGSIRTDVVLRDDQGEIIAIYDVKTGDRPLSRARADELRTMTRAAPNTPVFELNVLRGLNMKAGWESGRLFSLRLSRLRSI